METVQNTPPLAGWIALAIGVFLVVFNVPSLISGRVEAGWRSKPTRIFGPFARLVASARLFVGVCFACAGYVYVFNIMPLSKATVGYILMIGVVAIMGVEFVSAAILKVTQPDDAV